MEEKLTFTRVPDSVYWLCNSNFQQSKKSYASIVDTFQKDPALKQLLRKALPTGAGLPSMEAQLSGYGVKGFRDRLSEIYLSHLELGHFPDTVELDRVIDVQDFELRFERFSTLSDYRVFMLGLYLKMRDIESLSLFSQHTDYISIPLEVDEILAANEAKLHRLDWMIIILTSLLKFRDSRSLIELIQKGPESVVSSLLEMDGKSKMIFFNDMSAYGSAIGEKEFFLYQRV